MVIWWPDVTGFDFSPTRDRVVYGESLSGSIRVAWLESLESEVIQPTGREPKWAPDGGRIVFVNSGSLYTCNPDGSDTRLLVARQLVQQGQYTAHSAAYAPTSDHIAYRWCWFLRHEGSCCDIYRIPAAGGTKVNLAGDVTTCPWPMGWR